MVGDTGLEPVTSAMSTEARFARLESYLNRLNLQGLSVNYVNKVREFLERYVEEVRELTPASAISYLSRYARHKPTTRARYTTYLKGFFNFLGIHLELRVKVPKSLPPFIAAEDIEKLRTSLLNKKTHKGCGFRDLTLVDTAAKTGLRRSELANLRVRDLDFGALRLKVVDGKGGKDRVVPLLPTLAESLRKLCAGKERDERVFGLSPVGLGMKIHTWAKKVGVQLNTHSFRHHFATTLVERGANLRAVQELLGHSNLNTTQLYVAVTGKHLDDAIKLLA